MQRACSTSKFTEVLNLPPVQESTRTLSDGSELIITAKVASSASKRRLDSLQATIYMIAGRISNDLEFVGGYVGQSDNLVSQRPGASFTRWVIDQKRIAPTGMALVSAPHWSRGPFIRFVEARIIRELSSRGLWLLNTQTSAVEASRNLCRSQVLHGQGIALEIADTLHEGLFANATNPHPSPSSNVREAAVRLIRHSPRALNINEVIEGLKQIGVTSDGRTWDHTIRRDLTHREPATRGTPRIYSEFHNNRHLFWGPNVRKRQAIHAYERAHNLSHCRLKPSRKHSPTSLGPSIQSSTTSTRPTVRGT